VSGIRSGEKAMNIEREEDRAANRLYARAYRKRLREKAKACPELADLIRKQERERKRRQRAAAKSKPDGTTDFFS
jgi:hypothetical protein